MAQEALPEGVFSFLDTDLYKLTMQSAVLKFFPDVEVEYAFTNRTPQMRLSKDAFKWLQEQVSKLANITLSHDERAFLEKQCKFLRPEYLDYLQKFKLRPTEQVHLSFENVDGEYGDLSIATKGLWLETILYEIPLLALTSEAYFKFIDKDWDHEGQEEKAYRKGIKLFDAGCMVSEFGSRRRRDLHTQDLVIGGLVRASTEGGRPGKLTGSSNVYLAMRHGIPPVGTVAHEWYMAIASITNDYENANELGLDYWLKCFGEGVLGIALTDTFGTPAFFKAFKKNIPSEAGDTSKTYAQVFSGIRQDSGDPKDYTKLAADFYASQGISGKSLVFSDSLNTDLCIEYKGIAESCGFKPSFGVGTFFTNDYTKKSNPEEKSKPLNIVIKISKAGGRPAIKISDNVGKNTGDKATVNEVKDRLGYSEKGWAAGDESRRW
ncbi:nicotinate phosphoribosyltransferase [Knufia fluminis]|uniref:Nicotinate phosphoribosyltransferase n=1 Tax=Knufia fluminis TaxID=191047 RepID=A0AAN8EC04_9EURO|nr:nicotinate phosphoribosyltransferase [Knufia fluminis]